MSNENLDGTSDDISQGVKTAVNSGSRKVKQSAKVAAKKLGKKVVGEAAKALSKASITSALTSTLVLLGWWIIIPVLIILLLAILVIMYEDDMYSSKTYSSLVEENSYKKENIRSFEEKTNSGVTRLRTRDSDNSSVDITSTSFNTVELSEGNQAIENYHYYKSSESVLNNKMYIATQNIDVTKKDKELFDELVKKGIVEYGGNEVFMNSGSLSDVESQWKKDYGDVEFKWEDESVKKDLDSRLNGGITIKGFGDKYVEEIKKIDDEKKKAEIKDAYGREEYFQLPEELLGTLNRKIYGEDYIYDDPFVQAVKFKYGKKKEDDKNKEENTVNKDSAKNNYKSEDFDKHFKKSGELEGKGNLFLKYAKKYDVDAALVVAIACKESEYGTNDLAKKYKNVLGLTKSGEVQTYNNIDEGIEEGIKDISRNIGKGLTSLEQIGKQYHQASYSEWAKEVGDIYKKITGKKYSKSKAGKGIGIDVTAFRSVPDYEFQLDMTGLKNNTSEYGLGSVFIYKPSINLEVKRGVEVEQVLKTSGEAKELIKTYEEDYKKGDKLDTVKGKTKDKDGNEINTETKYELIEKEIDGKKVKKKKVSIFKVTKEYEATATANAIEDVSAEIVYLLDKVVTFAGVYEFEYELVSEETASENSNTEREVAGSAGLKEVKMVETKTIKMYEKPSNVKSGKLSTRYMDIYLSTFKGIVPRHIVTKFNVNRMVKAFKGAKGSSDGSSSSESSSGEKTSDHENVEQWRELVEEYASEYGMDPNLILTMIFMESSGNPHAGNSNYKGLLAIGGDSAGAIDTYEYMPNAILDSGPNDSRIPNCSGSGHNEAEHERAARFQIEYACKRLSDWMYRNTKYMYNKGPKDLTEDELALVALSAVGSYPAPYGQWTMMKLINKNYELLFSSPGTVWQEYHKKADAIYGNMNSGFNSGYLKKFHENYSIFSGGVSIEDGSTFEVYDPEKWYVQNKNASYGGDSSGTIVTSSNGTNMNPEKVKAYIEYEKYGKVITEKEDTDEEAEKKLKRAKKAVTGTITARKSQQESKDIRNGAIAMIKQKSTFDVTERDEKDVFWGKGFASKYFDNGLQSRPLYGDEMSEKTWAGKIKESTLYTGGIDGILDLARSYGKDVYVIVKRAVELEGAKYKQGKSGPFSFDHAGMLWYVFNSNSKVDYFEKGSVQEQYKKLNITVNNTDIRPGDIIFYSNVSEKSDDPTRIGIYLGNHAYLGVNESEGELQISNYKHLKENSDIVINGVKRVIKYSSGENSTISGLGGLPPDLVSGDWLDPLYNANYRGTSGFGMRIHPITGKWTFHRGLDWSAGTGSPVAATKAGRVIWASPKGTYGNCVILDNGDDYTSLYAHLSVIDVKVGDIVEQGQIIGKVGSTGRSTGPHLHFEIAYKVPNHTSGKEGEYPEGSFIDPKKVIKKLKG